MIHTESIDRNGTTCGLIYGGKGWGDNDEVIDDPNDPGPVTCPKCAPEPASLTLEQETAKFAEALFNTASVSDFKHWDDISRHSKEAWGRKASKIMAQGFRYSPESDKFK